MPTVTTTVTSAEATGATTTVTTTEATPDPAPAAVQAPAAQAPAAATADLLPDTWPATRVTVDVAGKVALITGASRGIGEATARLCASKGIKVVLAARSVDKLEAIKADIEAAGGAAIVAKCDVTVPSEVRAAFDLAKSTWGGVDFVYANAGYEGDLADITEIDDDEMFKIVNINVMGYLYTMKYAFIAFKERGGGAIIFTSSIASIVPLQMTQVPLMKTMVPYAVTKAANDHNARLASAWNSDNIRSYGILPACFETYMLKQLAKAQGSESTDPLAGFNPVYQASIGNPDRIADVALSMFDNSTAYASGKTVVCDNDATVEAQFFYNMKGGGHAKVDGHGLWKFDVAELKAVINDFKGDPHPGPLPAPF